MAWVKPDFESSITANNQKHNRFIQVLGCVTLNFFIDRSFVLIQKRI